MVKKKSTLFSEKNFLAWWKRGLFKLNQCRVCVYCRGLPSEWLPSVILSEKCVQLQKRNKDLELQKEISAGAIDSSFLQKVQPDSGSHPASHSMGPADLSGGKVAVARSWTLQFSVKVKNEHSYTFALCRPSWSGTGTTLHFTFYNNENLRLNLVFLYC